MIKFCDVVLGTFFCEVMVREVIPPALPPPPLATPLLTAYFALTVRQVRILFK